MSAIELDVPVLISAEQIRRREFVTIRRGYDPDQVRDYLEQLADQVDVMASMIREARLEAEAALRANAEPKADPYERLAARVATVIREADEAAERFRLDGRRDAERILTEARSDADRIRVDAQAQAEEARSSAEVALREAREQADRTLAGLSTRREALVDQLAKMQERLLGVAKDLEAAIESPESVPTAIAVTTDDEEGEPQREAVGPWGAMRAAGGGERVVDVREPRGPFGAGSLEAQDVLFPPGPETRDEDLWAGTDTIGISMPDIPPLDLGWDEDQERDEGSG